ncbi:MAG: hypothetical protein HY243_10895 [Proteobacteria bacterium]|nr:hypothetical protein [Pseudomonadota bacterium]
MTPIKTCLVIGALALSATSGSALAVGSHGSQMGQQQSFMRQSNPVMPPSMNSQATKPSTPPSSPQTAATTPSGQEKGKGQPNQSCETTGTTPGNAADAPGSAFNPTGKAGTKYAGQQPQNSKNPVSVSQYDVACSHQPH